MIPADGNEHVSLVDMILDFDVSDLEEIHTVSIEMANDMVTTSHTEVYDSGYTRHITLYLDTVENFTAIHPKLFQAVNK